MAPLETYYHCRYIIVLTVLLLSLVCFNHCFYLNTNPTQTSFANRRTSTEKTTDCINSYGAAVKEYDPSWYDEFKKRKSKVPFHVYIHTITSGTQWLNILVDMILGMQKSIMDSFQSN